MTTAAGGRLRRSLGPIGVMLLTLSALSPAFSFYIAGDTVLRMAGTGAGLAYLAGGLGSAILALLFAEVGAAFPGAGGVYPSLAGALGQMLAFPYVILLAPVAFAGTAFIALGLSDYLAVLWPGEPRILVTLASLGLATGIAVLNIRTSSWITGLFLAVEAAALALLAGIAALHPVRPLVGVLIHPVMLDQGRLIPTPPATLALATVSGLWATAGSIWALYFAEEMHEARQKIGRVIAWTGALAACAIALPMALTLMSAPDVKTLLGAPSPLADFLRQRAGPGVAAAVSVGVIAANFNCLVVSLMAYGRYIFSTARDGLWSDRLNRALSHIQPQNGAPVRATLVVAALAAAAVFLGERFLLILISGNVADYLLISLAIFIGRRTGRTGKDFRAPAHPLVPVFGLLVTAACVMADLMDPDAGRPSAILLASLFVGALIYFHFRLREASRNWRLMPAQDAPPKA